MLTSCLTDYCRHELTLCGIFTGREPPLSTPPSPAASKPLAHARWTASAWQVLNHDGEQWGVGKGLSFPDLHVAP
ncbi:hypothetical protein EJC51_47370 [Streptomyces aquilus]|uniref:Uncharacterized protein n=1 Tax=Streptomyces aquilus TaxID=2548456 RepID=A0A3S9HRI8_9ACTN|nr:hypothetical protein EJC51_00175 [Streptomyces aquilus]AZP22974.1 hypothetical protein EJC51_47370 [Streptomyces aquilus]